MCKKFGVTPELARLLNLKSIVPPEIKEERKPKVKRQRRKEFIERYLNLKPNATNLEIAKDCSQNGHPISRQHLGKLLSKAGRSARIAGRPLNEKVDLDTDSTIRAQIRVQNNTGKAFLVSMTKDVP